MNGLASGWQGSGSKTVLPAEARAKITCRLVAKQSRDAIVDAVRTHVERHCPPGVSAEAIGSPGNSEPFLIPAGHAATQLAEDVLRDVYGCAPYRTRLGGGFP